MKEIGAGTSEIRRMLIGRELMAETTVRSNWDAPGKIRRLRNRANQDQPWRHLAACRIDRSESRMNFKLRRLGPEDHEALEQSPPVFPQLRRLAGS